MNYLYLYIIQIKSWDFYRTCYAILFDNEAPVGIPVSPFIAILWDC